MKITKFSVAGYLDSPELMAAYLSECFAEADHALIAAALREACKAKGMSTVAAEAGIARESLYKALRPESKPQMSTILGVLKALGMRVTVKPF